MCVFIRVVGFLKNVFNLGHNFFSHWILVEIRQSYGQVGISQKFVRDCGSPITRLILSILFLFHDWLNSEDYADGFQNKFDCLGWMVKRSHLKHFLLDNSSCVIFGFLNSRFNLLDRLLRIISQLPRFRFIGLTLHFFLLQSFSLNF